MIKPAIVAVGYNRPHCMKRLLKSIGNAKYDVSDITLIVSIDESNRSDEVEAVAREFEWKYGEKIIRRFPERQGLKNHIIQCGDLSEQYGAVIILEDDLFVSPGFYKYVCDAHEFYGNNPKIAGVSLYSNGVNVFDFARFVPSKNNYDNYLGQYIITWGESWTYEQWKKYKAWFLEHEDKLPSVNDAMPEEILRWTRSWGKYFISYMVENDLYYVMGYTAHSTNFAEQGEHSTGDGYETAYQVPLLSCPMEYRFAPFDEAVKYDSFFERVYDGEIAPGIDGRDVCFNLYGLRFSPLGKKYLLTTKEHSFELIKEFGLRMRPVEENVLYDIEGDGIKLYKINGDEELVEGRNIAESTALSVERVRYEVQGLQRRQLAPYLRKLTFELIRRKARKLLKRK